MTVKTYVRVRANDTYVLAVFLLEIQAASDEALNALICDRSIDVCNDENIVTLEKVLLCSSDSNNVDVTETCDKISIQPA